MAKRDDVVLAAKEESNIEERGVVLMFERLARDDKVDVEKLERLIQMQERVILHNAKASFDAAFAEMQSFIPEVDKRGRIVVDGQVRTRYATNEDIQKTLRPILKTYGFALSFRTEWPGNGLVRIVGILTHREGHSRESYFEGEADTSGKKNAIQALGSTVSYGHRYTTVDLLNITSRGEDDDGQASRPQPAKAHAPKSTDSLTISDPQRRRLFVIIKNSGRTQDEVREWLQARYHIASTKTIIRALYNEICAAIEHPGDLPMREPGDE